MKRSVCFNIIACCVSKQHLTSCKMFKAEFKMQEKFVELSRMYKYKTFDLIKLSNHTDKNASFICYAFWKCS